MNPVNVIIWTCVAIFIVTAILTLLHISGIRPLPNDGHGKVLFKSLIIQVVVIAVGAFASVILPKDVKPYTGGIPGSMANDQGIFLSHSINDKSPPLLLKPNDINNTSFNTQQIALGNNENCHQITVSDASTLPPTSHIETVCDK